VQQTIKDTIDVAKGKRDASKAQQVRQADRQTAHPDRQCRVRPFS
jgi:hypothetical protein